MQYLVSFNFAIKTSFALELSLSPALVLSFRIFSDDIPCLNIFFTLFFLGERDRDMFEIDHNSLYLADFSPPKNNPLSFD